LKITIKLSGHVLFPSLEAVPDLRGHAAAIRKAKARGHSPFVVVGGGEPARHLIRVARENGADESTCDQIGIAVANINALIFARALGEDAFQHVPESTDELDKALSSGKIVVMGGLQPGQSTNAVSCVLAEKSGSSLLINTTTVDGVYSSDPKKDPSSKKFSEIKVKDLTKILEGLGTRAGEYDLLDPVALRMIQRSKLLTKVIDGRDPKNILRAIEGEDIGTNIVP
jgi:uridylate kinase